MRHLHGLAVVVMAIGRAVLPAFGTRRVRLAVTLGTIVLLAFVPALVSRAVESRTSMRITVADLRDPSVVRAAAVATRLRQERRQSEALIVLTPTTLPSSFCAVEQPPTYCAEISEFPTVALSRAGSAAEAVALLYGEGRAPVDRGFGVYGASRTTHGGAGLAPALLVGLFLALGPAFLLLAPVVEAPATEAPSANAPGAKPLGDPSAGQRRAESFSATGPPRPRALERTPPAARSRGSVVVRSREATMPVERELREPPAVGDEVVCRSHFGPAGGYVCFGGVLVVWAELATPSAGARPGDRLTVVGADPYTGLIQVAAVTSHQPPCAEEAR